MVGVLLHGVSIRFDSVDPWEGVPVGLCDLVDMMV